MRSWRGAAPAPASIRAQQQTVAVDSSRLAEARALLRRHPVFDGHNDLPWAIRTAERPLDVEAYHLRDRTPGHTDLARLRSRST